MVFVLQRTLQVSSEYYAVAAVSRQSLAVGYRFGRGIDLIKFEGQVLRQICLEYWMQSSSYTFCGPSFGPNISPDYMVILNNGDLVLLLCGWENCQSTGGLR
ncbi:hypothetical protein PoB_005429800 [Plakobranchus ocellatus]|uniref:TLDc domain-containing protein n=1 Tax=Plakobranchus ocellatus TaxID=259542 RepID=A0AAV4C9Y8_9GAST|nr:hypothetical protein PoB_005429800 [Plakobranchus ocellatus]